MGCHFCQHFLLRCINRRDTFRPKSGFAGLGLVFGALVFVANVVYPDFLDVNPRYSKEDLVGEWRAGTSRLIFDKSGSAIFSLDPTMSSRFQIFNGSGQWMRTGDFEVRVGKRGSPESDSLRVVRYREELRLIIQDFSDFDTWDGDLGFQKSTN